MNQLKQTLKEIQIFKKFAKICPYKIDLNSIVKKEPPELDIYCELINGTQLVFEIVECINEPIASKTHDLFKLSSRLNEALNNLNRLEKEEFNNKYKDTIIDVEFNSIYTLKNKILSLPKIIKLLLTLEYKVTGEFTDDSIKELKEISIERGFQGLLLRAGPAVTSCEDPTENALKSKFKKTYSIKFKRVELLAYYELQPEIPENYFQNNLKEFIKNKLNNSPFHRVWLYSFTQNRIIFVWPEINK